MGFKCGIIGLPNVGKTTLFNLLTKSNNKAANFPFCTIKPNVGMAIVPDERLDKLAKIVNSQHIVHSAIEFIDIAGLVKGASKGEGLGNQFLENIRETEAIVHVVRCFKNDNIIHITGDINPREDINIINAELIISDINTCENAIRNLSKKSKIYDRSEKFELVILNKILLQLENSNMLYSLGLNNEEIKLIKYLNFLTLKPIMYIANVYENGFEDNLYLNQVYTIAEKENSLVIPICASIKKRDTNLNDGNYNQSIKNSSSKERNIDNVIQAGYMLLNLQTYFTVGKKEVRAWTIPIGTTALQAAKKIHTDFKKGFIRVKTISYKDFITYNGEQGAKEFGKVRYEGKDYIIKDGDILNFLFKV